MSSIIKVNTVQDQDGNNIINENANTITIGASGDTISIPAGATLANNGTATGFATIEWQSSIVTAATLTAVAGRGYWIDTSSNACTVTFPAAASVGDQIILTDYARNWATNAVTINQNSLNFQGFTSPNPVYNTNGQSVDLVYSGTTKGWIPNSDDDVAFKNPPYDAEYLLIAGGGGGAYGNGGGGGAGGGGNGGKNNSTNSIAQAPTNGTANTGGGGGGASNRNVDFPGGAGGSGVVILRVPTANYSGTTTGSPTVTTDGSDKVLVFNGDGSYTG